MTAQELIDAYPDCRHAVMFAEDCIAGPEGKVNLALMAEHGATPQWCAKHFALFARQVADDPEAPEEIARLARKAIPQFSHPEFLTYAAGILGCM